MFYHDKVEHSNRALQWILQSHFNVVSVTHLLDDFIFVRSYNEPTFQNSLLSFDCLAQEMYIPLNETKRCLPTTCQIVYGIEIDTNAMQLRLPQDKLSRVLSLVNRMAKCRKVTLRDMLLLIGLLSFARLVVFAGRSVLRRLLSLC